MNNKAELLDAEQRILVSMSERIASLGFDPKWKGQSFYRRHAAGKWVSHVSFIPHKTDFDLTVDVAVRLSAIEDLVNAYDTKMNAIEKRQSTTLGGELGNLTVGAPVRWNVSSFDDIPTICDEVVNALTDIGLRFLETHSSVEAAYRVLASSDKKDILLAPILGPRYMRAVACAYLLGDSSSLEKLAHQYEVKLIQTDDLYLQDFRSLYRGLLQKAENAAAQRV